MSFIHQEDEDIHYTEIYVWGGKLLHHSFFIKISNKVIIVVN